MAKDIIVPESLRNNPFYDRTVVILGKFGNSNKALRDQLKKMGAEIKGSPTKNVNYVLIGFEPDEEKMTYLDTLAFNGYQIRRLYKEDVERILAGDYEGYETDKDLQKDLVLTYEHFTNTKNHLQIEGLLSPLVEAEVYCGGDLKGEMKYLAQMIGYAGGYCNTEIANDVSSKSRIVVLFSDKTVERLQNGEVDEYAKYVQDFYNNTKAKNFNIRFTSESEILAWVRKRVETCNDTASGKMLDLYEKK